MRRERLAAAVHGVPSTDSVASGKDQSGVAGRLGGVVDEGDGTVSRLALDEDEPARVRAGEVQVGRDAATPKGLDQQGLRRRLRTRFQRLGDRPADASVASGSIAKADVTVRRGVDK